MNAGIRKRKPVNNFQKDDLPGTLKNEKNNNRNDNGEITEVDDKLIGDDLDLKEAQQGYQDKEVRLENEENNY